MTQGPEVLRDLVASLPRLRSVARGFARNDSDADDLVQGTCLRVLGRLARLRHSSRPKTQALFLRIMKNLHIDAVRHHRRLRPITDEIPAPFRAPIPEWRSISDEALTQAVAALPAGYREVWCLSQTPRLKQRDIARALNLKTGTVATRAHRARLALRERLQQELLREDA